MTAEALEDDTVAPPRGADATVSTTTATVVLVDDEPTVAIPRRRDGAAWQRELPASASSAPVLSPQSAPRLGLPDGRHLTLVGPTILGRAPREPRIADGIPRALVALSSPTRDVSASHVEIRPTATATTFVVTDLHSTNGTVVLLADGTRRRLVAGDAIVVPVGTVLLLGDGLAVSLLGPTPRSAGDESDGER